MTVEQSLNLTAALSKYFPNGQDAATIVKEVEAAVDNKFESQKSIFFTKDDKIDLIDRINKAKTETIIWIVGTGVLQFVLSILAKKFL